MLRRNSLPSFYSSRIRVAASTPTLIWMSSLILQTSGIYNNNNNKNKNINDLLHSIGKNNINIGQINPKTDEMTNEVIHNNSSLSPVTIIPENQHHQQNQEHLKEHLSPTQILDQALEQVMKFDIWKHFFDVSLSSFLPGDAVLPDDQMQYLSETKFSLLLQDQAKFDAFRRSESFKSHFVRSSKYLQRSELWDHLENRNTLTIEEYLKNFDTFRKELPVHIRSKIDLIVDKQITPVVEKALEAASKHPSIRNVLRCGFVKRHTYNPPWGPRTRNPVLGELVSVLEEFRGLTDTTKELHPLLALNAPTRQGKSILLDFVANSPRLVEALGGTVDNTLVFNITCNSDFAASNTWPKQQNLSTADMIVDETAAQLGVRLLASAMDLPNNDAMTRYFPLLRYFATPSTSEKSTDAPSRVITTIRRYFEGNYRLILVDEFTKLIDASRASKEVQPAMYSALSSLISAQSAVIYNGFVFLNTVDDPNDSSTSNSGRSLLSFRLLPPTEFDQRRQLLLMSTSFFQRCAENVTSSDDAVYYSELAKLSPGVFGALLQSLHELKNVSGLTERIPVLKVLDGNTTHAPRVVDFLSLKSLQMFEGFESTPHPWFEELCRDLEKIGVVQLAGAKITKEDMQKVKTEGQIRSVHWVNLKHFRAEPLFLSFLIKGKVSGPVAKQLGSFFTMLENYSKMVVDLKNYDMKKSVDENRFMEVTGSDGRQKVGRQDDLAGKFFEDATATGILLQRNLRRHNEKYFQHFLKKSLSVDSFLPGIQHIFGLNSSNLTSDSTSKFGPSIVLVPTSNEDECKIYEFKGTFPAGNSRENLTVDHLRPEFVLRPQRPETNPGFDICFTELASVEIDRSIEKVDSPQKQEDRYVFFGVDTKQSDSRPIPCDALPGSSVPFSKFARETVGKILFGPSLLVDDRANIDHFVHIIVTAYIPSSAEISEIQAAVSSPNIVNSSNSTSPIKSYSLFFLHPSTLGFQNLVSQPIAAAIPFLDQQFSNLWYKKVGEFSTWWNYKATKRNVAQHIQSASEFREWRHLCFEEDGAITFPHLFKDEKEFESFFKNNDLVKQQQAQNEQKCDNAAKAKTFLYKLYFGSFLDWLELLPPSWWSVGSKNHYNAQITIAPSENGEMNVIVNKKNAPLEILPINLSSELLKVIWSNLTLGHLLHKHGEETYDAPFSPYYSSSTIWEKIFEQQQQQQETSETTQASSFGFKEFAGVLWHVRLEEWMRATKQQLQENGDGVVHLKFQNIYSLSVESNENNCAIKIMKTIKKKSAGGTTETELKLEGDLAKKYCDAVNEGIKELKKKFGSVFPI